MQDKPIISPLGEPFIELQSVDSTNNYALGCIRNGNAQHGAAFLALEQTAGKGQRGRKWNAQKGANILLSIVLQPTPLLISMQFQLSVCIAVSVQKFFARYAGHGVRIKWPNDLYWQDRKAGGILIENSISGSAGQPNQAVPAGESAVSGNASSGWKWAVAGIGININQTRFPAELNNPVSLWQITGKQHVVVQLAKELCSIANDHFNRLIGNGFDSLFREYNNVLYKRNETVTLKKDNRTFKATVKGVSPQGQLIVCRQELDEKFDFGEITWII